MIFNLKEKAIFRKAVEIEINAQRLYEALAKKSKTKNGRVLFEALVCEEQKHEAIIKDFMRTKNVEASRTKVEVYKQGFSVHDKLIDPNYDEYDLAHGIILAVHEERKSARIYLDLYERACKQEKDLAFKNILITLIKEEKHHEAILIGEYRHLFGTWDENK